MSQDAIDRITSLVGQFDDRVQACPQDAWDNQSPCAEWKARDVVAHVGGNLQRVTGALTGSGPAAFDAGDLLGSWAVARDQFLQTVQTADLAQELPGPFGVMPAHALIGQIVSTDTLVHTWDLARAVGGDEQLDQGAVAGAFRGLQAIDDAIRKPGLFDAKIEANEGDDLQAQFLRFLGRQF